MPQYVVKNRQLIARNRGYLTDVDGRECCCEDDCYQIFNLCPDLSGFPQQVAVRIPPTQACCFPDGTCQDLCVVECSEQGGVSQGVGTTCQTTLCSDCAVINVQCTVEDPNDLLQTGCGNPIVVSAALAIVDPGLWRSSDWVTGDPPAESCDQALCTASMQAVLNSPMQTFDITLRLRANDPFPFVKEWTSLAANIPIEENCPIEGEYGPFNIGSVKTFLCPTYQEISDVVFTLPTTWEIAIP